MSQEEQENTNTQDLSRALSSRIERLQANVGQNKKSTLESSLNRANVRKTDQDLAATPSKSVQVDTVFPPDTTSENNVNDLHVTMQRVQQKVSAYRQEGQGVQQKVEKEAGRQKSRSDVHIERRNTEPANTTVVAATDTTAQQKVPAPAPVAQKVARQSSQNRIYTRKSSSLNDLYDDDIAGKDEGKKEEYVYNDTYEPITPVPVPVPTDATIHDSIRKRRSRKKKNNRSRTGRSGIGKFFTGIAPYEWMIAKRYLRTRRKEGFVSVIAGFSLVGIALGVATLIIVMAVMNGFRTELVSRILGVNGHVTAYAVSEPYFTDYVDVTQRISRIEGVTRVAPIIEGQLMVSSSRTNAGAVVRGIRLEDLRNLPAVSEPESAMGNLDSFADGTGVAVASGLAFKLGLGVGEKISLISPKGASTPFGTTPRIKSYTVQYIFKIGMSEYDNAFIYMPLSEAQLYFNRVNEAGIAGVDMLEIMVDDPETVEQYTEQIGVAAEQPIRVFTWRDANASFINALNIERNVMFIILTMIILVAALNIISGLIMLVKDKGRDVAILRTIGVPKRAVMRIFFMCGASIGVIGTIAGVAIGLLFCWNIEHIEKFVAWITGADLFSEDVYFLSNLPADVQTGDVLLTIFIALGLSFAATLYPSWRAARLDPVEALRYE